MKCIECQQEMTDPKTVSCVYDVIGFGNNEFYYRSRYHFGEAGGRCHDCRIEHGRYHHFGCDVERCPKCGRQLISCGCATAENVGLYMDEDLQQQPLTKPILQPVTPLIEQAELKPATVGAALCRYCAALVLDEEAEKMGFPNHYSCGEGRFDETLPNGRKVSSCWAWSGIWRPNKAVAKAQKDCPVFSPHPLVKFIRKSGRNIVKGGGTT